MNNNQDVNGNVGFDNTSKKSKEKSEKNDMMLFSVDENGKAIPEKYFIKIYDRNIDKELIEESQMLMLLIKKKKAFDKVLKKLKEQEAQEIIEIEDKIKNETDENKLLNLKLELSTKKSNISKEEIQSMINHELSEEGIIESREIINNLNIIKKEQTIIKEIELVPCNLSESKYSIEMNKTIDGKDSEDWIADLISNKVINPSFTFDEAKNLKLNYKIAMKDAIMEVSGYKILSYKDIMMQQKLEIEKPLILKKKDKI